jgi:xanthine dehydrogenase accessory factor
VRDVLEALVEEARSGRRTVLATIVRASGSTPRTLAARMLVRADGTQVGTIGGGAFEAMVVADALTLLARPAPAPEVRRYVFTEHGEDALGMACGGTAEVLLEAAATGPRLLIFGAGHVGLALARLAGPVGFACEIVDDREEFCATAERAGIARVHRCDAEYGDGVPAIDEGCYVAVVTRCHRTDRLALKTVLKRPAAYVGLIGSRRKKSVIFRELTEADGVDPEALGRVRCPIGLPLGGETPEEIALSIVAELQQTRYRGQ